MSGKENEQVLSVWSVKDLVQDPIYSEMVLFNQLTIKEQIVHLTNFLEPAKPEKTDQPKESAWLLLKNFRRTVTLLFKTQEVQ